MSKATAKTRRPTGANIEGPGRLLKKDLDDRRVQTLARAMFFIYSEFDVNNGRAFDDHPGVEQYEAQRAMYLLHASAILREAEEMGAVMAFVEPAEGETIIQARAKFDDDAEPVIYGLTEKEQN